MSSILIIYGTTSGNTEMVVDKVAEILENDGHHVTLQRVEKSAPEDILKFDFCILASPTYGHGLLQDYFIPFEKAMRTLSLKGRRLAVIGLGDAKYDAQYHIEAAALLEKAVEECGGALMCPSLKITRTPVPHLEGKVEEWAEGVNRILLSS